MNMRHTLWLCVLLLIAPISLAGQNISSLSENIRRVVREQETGWEISQDKDYVDEQSSGVILLAWKSGGASVEAIITMSELRGSAVRNYHDVEHGRSFVGTEMTLRKNELFSVGDEHFAWVDAHDPETHGVVFVKGRVFAYLRTRDMAVAERFAKDIAAGIPEN
jgi:hypothetical protein